ncbi:helix-turn-helix domain-containing protein [Rhizobium binxianense]
MRPQILSLQAGAISIVRMRSNRSDHDESGPIPQADAFSVIAQLRPFENHRLWRGGKLVYEGGHQAGTLAITDLCEEWRCHHRSAFDNVRFRISRQGLLDFSYEAGRPDFKGLDCRSGQLDPVVQGLAMALLPSLSQPLHASALFIDHVLLALQAHLVTRYGGVSLPVERGGGLSARQLNLATSLLASSAGKEVTISDVATQCGLSTSYFIRAFRKSTGRTPHRWLMEYRAEKARQMLLGTASIAEIAVACGFADQSHLTRIFTAIHGVSPGNWRRERRV